MVKRKFGVGVLSLLLCILGVAWAFTFRSFCIGDQILNSLGLRAWTNGNTGTHFTIYYSLIFFVPAFLIGSKFNEDFGAQAGKKISMAIGLFILLSILGLTL